MSLKFNGQYNINILIYHKCPTCSGGPIPASSERTAVSAVAVGARLV